MESVLVTGANGFVGRHLTRALVARGLKVTAIGGHAPSPKDAMAGVNYQAMDLNNLSEVKKINFKDIDTVIHLAALATLGPSFDHPMEYIKVNLGIESNLFEVALDQKAHPKFIIISSSTVYSPRSKQPLQENSEIMPSSPYALSKLGQEQLASYYSLRDFDCIIARPFNHFGPGQGSGFIVPDLARQVIESELDKSKVITVGNLSSKRDYTDVRDIVRAYVLLLTKGKPGETYNICSGQPLSGQQILDAILKETGAKPKIVVDKSIFRPSDTPIVYGSYEKLKKATGWQPEIDFDTTITDVVADWRTRL